MAWIRNTSKYPDDEVRELVKFATQDVNMSRVCVNVKGGRGLGGRAYMGVPSISNAPRSAQYLMTVKLGNGVAFPLGPRNYNGSTPDEVGPRNRFPFFTYADWREWLVHTAAHEARHIHQYRHGAPCSEVDCERFAEKVLRRYRERRPAW
jgi:hypothetical protein